MVRFWCFRQGPNETSHKARTRHRARISRPTAERVGHAVSSAGHDRLRRPHRPHRDDGTGVCPEATVAFASGIPRYVGEDQFDPRPELNGNGDFPWLPSSGLGRIITGWLLLHFARDAHDGSHCLVLLTVWLAAASGSRLVWGQ